MCLGRETDRKKGATSGARDLASDESNALWLPTEACSESTLCLCDIWFMNGPFSDSLDQSMINR